MTNPTRLRIPSRQRGFTLLEVLVALVIVGTALGAGLRAVGSLTANSSGLRASMMATWSAENRLVQIRLGKSSPARIRACAASKSPCSTSPTPTGASSSSCNSC
jgi:general secretion pathway protein I